MCSTSGCNHDELRVTRLDPTINFNWGDGSPDPEVSVDNFSARWVGFIVPRFSETYTFAIGKDDGARLWIGDKQLINSWDGCGEPSGAMDLEANKFYPIKVEFVEYGGGACISFSWWSARQPREVVPTERLYPDIPHNIVIATADADDPQQGAISILGEDLTPKPLTTQPGAIMPSVNPAGQILFSVGWHANWTDPKTIKNTELYVTSPDGKSQKRIKGSSYGEITPAYGIDGKRIAFASNRQNGWQIYTMNADAGQLRQATANATDNLWPALCPNGAWLVYQTKRDGKWAIARVSANGGEETVLTDQGDNQYPVISPDGDHLLFASNRDGHYQIYQMDADGGNPKRLTETKTGDDTHPRYTANGQEIGFLSTRDGAGDLYLMNADGTKVTRLTTCGKLVSFGWNL